MNKPRPIVSITASLTVGLIAWLSGCGSSSSDSQFPNGSKSDGGAGSGEDGSVGTFGGTGGDDDSGTGTTGPCVGLQCQQHTCTGGGTTTISGVVYDPALKNPLYDAVVYVPNAPVQALAQGATCDTCGSLYTGNPIATALTDSAGKFTIKNAPDGANIPLVIQIGKWRKQITIPNVAACTDNAQPDKSLSLPKNHSEGDIPNIAISTGQADTLECLLRRVGLDAAEYGPGPSGTGRIHIFEGNGTGNKGGAPNTATPAPRSATGLWDSKADLMKYDILLLSCEGGETTQMNQQALFDYAAAGGRVFSSHFHYSWFNTGPFGSANLATWTTGSNDIGDISADIVTTLPGGAVFPKGQALKEWLTNVNALSGGTLPIQQARHNADVAAANTASQAWITQAGANATEYFTFNTPLNAAPANQCGRVVFSDLHVGAASNDYNGAADTVPEGCMDQDLSPQEKALEFMLFDLSSCVTPDNQPPTAPPPSGIK